MGEDFNLDITLDTSKAEAQLKAVEDERQATEHKVAMTKQAANESFQKTLAGARLSWSLVKNISKAMGLTLDKNFELAVSMAFSTISILTPLLSAAAVTPGMQVQAALGFVELGAAIAAIVTAQDVQAAGKIQGLGSVIGNINTMIGMSY